jgi:hypothetical protein
LWRPIKRKLCALPVLNDVSKTRRRSIAEILFQLVHRLPLKAFPEVCLTSILNLRAVLTICSWQWNIRSRSL